MNRANLLDRLCAHSGLEAALTTLSQMKDFAPRLIVQKVLDSADMAIRDVRPLLAECRREVKYDAGLSA